MIKEVSVIKAVEAKPESLLNSVHCNCGASWTFKDGTLNYKPSSKLKREWVGLTDADKHSVINRMIICCGVSPASANINVVGLYATLDRFEQLVKEKNNE